MEDFLTSFFIAPFTGLAEGIATATSPLDVIDAVDGFVWGPIMILLLLGTHIFMTHPHRLHPAQDRHRHQAVRHQG